MSTKSNLIDHKKSIAVAYQLFADLVLGPFDKTLTTKIGLVPELKEAFEASYGSLENSSKENSDPQSELAADHYRVFGLQVFPFEGCFLSPKETSGSEIAEEISQVYIQCGFNTTKLESERPDHLGLELLFLSYLVSLELKFSPELTGTDKDAPKSVNSRKAQSKFLSEHVLQWIYPLKLAASKHNSSFYETVFEMISETIVEHWNLVQADLHASEKATSSEDSKVEKIDVDEFLSNPKTGLGSISRYLLNPAQSGFFLSRDSITKLGGNVNVPSSFGSRESSLKALFENAIDYERLDQVFELLEEASEEWMNEFKTAPESLKSFIKPWISRVQSTEEMLEKIQGNLKAKQ